MEEGTEAHMETDVSSTTDDVQVVEETEAAVSAAPRRDVHTVVTVESIKEEALSPRRNKETKQSDKLEFTKIAPKTPQEVTIKKIIIKSPLKDVQIKSIQKLPLKPEETKAAPKIASPSKLPQSPPAPQSENSVDSSSKLEEQVSSAIVDGSAQAEVVNSSESQKPVQKSPIKDSQLQEPTISKEGVSKGTPPKEQSTAKELGVKLSPLKEQPLKIILTKENSKSFVVKESPSKSVASKEILKPSPNKEAQMKVNSKESQNKATQLAKEICTKPISAKETSAKSIPSKESTAKTPQTKEQTGKFTPAKEQTKLLETTEKHDNEGRTEENVAKNKNASLLDDKEASNDSQVESSSDLSEKDHNKSISRELRSLINSAKESKIISECTQLTSKTRKSRAMDSANTSLNASVEADKIQGVRRGSDNSQMSNSSEKSDKPTLKRSMRSQNPEFVSKVKNFLNSVSGKSQKPDDASDEEMEEKKEKDSKEPKEVEKEGTTPSKAKKQKTEETALTTSENSTGNKLRMDLYCWRCHWGTVGTNEKTHAPVHCSVCPRSFHYKCLSSTERTKISAEKNWVCPECMAILQAESSETRSPAMKKISLGMLCDLLKHALDRMMEVNGVEPFMHPVDRVSFPDYDKYVVHPMDLGMMRAHINEGLYGSTEAFLADCQWILHNSIIFNTLQAKLTGGARALVRSCRAEMSEIEACPECYAAAHARRPTWFTDVCSTPHILLWAKLKGFPYWPAKGMSVNCTGMVDVRFFGAHDRAWVPARDCFLYSEKDPNNFRTKRQDILDSMQEAEQHIRNISRKYGKFVYPPFKTQFDATKLNEQIKLMIPSFEGDARSAVKEPVKTSSPGSVKEKSRSNSKSSKGSFNDGDMSEGETEVPARKMADGAEIARVEEDFSVDKDKDKDKPMEVDNKDTKETEKSTSRKRRRSELEEAVITIIDSSKEKRKKAENEAKPEEKKEIKDNKEQEKVQDKPKVPESKETKTQPAAEPSTSTDKKVSPKVNPIRVISISKVLKNAKVSPKVVITKDDDKTPAKQKKVEKPASEKEKSTPQDEKKNKRRNSKNKSLNNSNVGSNKAEKKSEKSVDTPKEKGKDPNKIGTESEKGVEKSAKNIQFDDDTSLAVLARESKNQPPGMPTITCVRSLSTITTTAKSPEVTKVSSDSSIFTPTSTDSVRTVKEAVNKLQKLRGDAEPPVGRVGVRAFARMTSPPDRDARPTTTTDVPVEVKSEPVEIEDDRQLQEKIDMMNAFKLRPVNPSANLREVRINKVVVTPLARKGSAPAPAPQVRPRAKKTFPQPKKPDEGRSELTSKNSMVYIPIQPPMTQAPLRAPRPIGPSPASTPAQRVVTSSTNNNIANNSLVNTVTAPLVPASVSSFSSPPPVPTSTPTSAPSVPTVPTVGCPPTTVHTMPLITSVNGQWTFSLQPVLSVGGVDGAPSPPIMNGLPERTSLVPIAPPGALVPAANTLPALAPLQANQPAPNNAVQTIVARTASSSTPGELPRLQQRPPLVNPLEPSAPATAVPPPSSVGPLTAKLNQNAVKMTDFFRNLLEDSLEKIDEPAAQLTAVRLQLEQAQWRHQQEINEIKHNHELMITEMRTSFEKEKVMLVSEARRQAQAELDAAVKQAKAKQWCANCNQEAQFYCCWNTSYCDYPCQRAHWPHHFNVCTQRRAQDNNGDGGVPGSPESRLQQAPENLPKTTAAPNLTAGSKLQPSRVYQEQAGPKPSIIVSMVEDNTGNQTMKCVGTFKPPSAPVQMSPLILNKQIMTSEEAAKKVVTSGGYLIVGASNSLPNSTTITQARRAQAIQYIS